MIIRNLKPNDIESLSRLHKAVFKKSLFSVNFPLNKLNLYFNTLLNINKYCFVAEDSNKKIVGYLIGGLRTEEAANQFMRTNKRTVLTILVLHPKLALIGILRNLKQFFKKNKKSKIKLRLYLIGISPNLTAKGIGSLLINKFEEEINKDGYLNYRLTVDKNNIKALSFYKKNGFQIEYEEDSDFCLVKKINNEKYK